MQSTDYPRLRLVHGGETSESTLQRLRAALLDFLSEPCDLLFDEPEAGV